MIRHISRRLRALGVVPAFEPGIESVAPQLWQFVAIHSLNSKVDPPPRREEKQVAQKHPGAVAQAAYEAGPLSRLGEAEHAAPKAAVADQYDIGLGHCLQNLSHRLGA